MCLDLVQVATSCDDVDMALQAQYFIFAETNMIPQLPFSLRIFVADCDPDGLRLVERSNWIGKAVVFPRALLLTVKRRDEFTP